MKTHTLKTWPEEFQAIRAGRKRHESRDNDRDFRVGEFLRLEEFVPHPACQGSGRVWGNGDKEDCGCAKPHGTYTGQSLLAQITYATPGGQWGLPASKMVLSIVAIRPHQYALEDDELAKLNAWDHQCKWHGTPDRYAGAIGGELTFSFTPTSLGRIAKVRCGCGAEIDLTEYSAW